MLEKHSVPGLCKSVLKSRDNVRAQWKHGHGLVFKIENWWSKLPNVITEKKGGG